MLNSLLSQFLHLMNPSKSENYVYYNSITWLHVPTDNNGDLFR